MSKATIILSGGMDSATLLYLLLEQRFTVTAISFNYGQRHIRELQSAEKLCKLLGVEHQVIDISGIKPLMKGSSLTDDIAVPHGHYQAENMKLTVVPNRNAIMLSIAWGIACCNGSDLLATAVHAGDHHIYPDCRPKFIVTLNEALRIGTEDHRSEYLKLYTPYLHRTKTDIAQDGHRLGVRYDLTWTCYDDGEIHCGKCGACQERKEAFADSNTPDPTEYAA